MNKRIEDMRRSILAGEHHGLRQEPNAQAAAAFTQEMAAAQVPDTLRAARRLAWGLQRETPVLLPGERIALLRTVPDVPELFTAAEWEQIRGSHRIHELGRVCNICPDYAHTIAVGLGQRRAEADAVRQQGLAEHGPQWEGLDFLTAVVVSIDAVLEFAQRYAREAAASGNAEVAELLERVPREGARTFHQALQSMRVLHFALWSSGTYHNTIGRLDQYLWPYLRDDLEAGRLDREGALELLEEFFLSFNRDSDLYPGVQQGDNGQSLVLGGMDAQGNDSWNLLTELCLIASLELRLIDPKTNLRVSECTALDRFELGTKLTAQGLGFPQYSNDDVVVPGLIDLGYEEADARGYVVAACWEFIIPGVGMDIPNVAALSFAQVVDHVIRLHLDDARSFDELLDRVTERIGEEARRLARDTDRIYMEPAPLMSVLMDGCVERARDVSLGLKYNNYGVHGTGLSNAADSLAAVRELIFESRELTPAQLIDALDRDFEGLDDLRTQLREATPKLGNNDDRVDLIAARLLEDFSAALRPLRNDRGGRFRAGTGSAMFYVTHGRSLGALPDGRKQGDYLSANLAPSIGVKVNGPLSVLRSFAKLPVRHAINGGPVTIEMHDTVFRTQESSRKVAQLVQGFIRDGGHQLQINALNRDELRHAQLHPQEHRNLIVRVWGWSAYFIELDKEYQDQIIQRVELA